MHFDILIWIKIAMGNVTLLFPLTAFQLSWCRVLRDLLWKFWLIVWRQFIFMNKLLNEACRIAQTFYYSIGFCHARGRKRHPKMISHFTTSLLPKTCFLPLGIHSCNGLQWALGLWKCNFQLLLLSRKFIISQTAHRKWSAFALAFTFREYVLAAAAWNEERKLAIICIH